MRWSESFDLEKIGCLQNSNDNNLGGITYVVSVLYRAP